MTDSKELYQRVLEQLAKKPTQFVSPELDEKLRRNAGRVMQDIVRQRLQDGGTDLIQQKNSRYAWRDGVILNRNVSVRVRHT